MGSSCIRRAEADDLPVIQEIARRTIDRCYRSFLGDEGVDWFINSGESDRELEQHLLDCDLLLLDEKVVAFTVYFDDLIHLMMVDADLQRVGLGAKLLAHSESRLFSTGKRVVRLETFEGNRPAISFYLKNGWSITRKQRDEDHGFTRLFFEKSSSD